MFNGSLRDQLAYPHTNDVALSDSMLEEVLTKVNLEHLFTQYRLDDVKDWSSILSLGQQQRISFARLLLRPNVRLALIDEGTSACDSANEELLYSLLEQHVRSYVSVGHRPSLHRFHSQVLRMKRVRTHDACETVCDVLPMAQYQHFSARKDSETAEGMRRHVLRVCGGA
eukprot:TRINITY_DN19281_c0_g1_i2.p1 TRINITY_DN19281_c0_g1~~TRINITY_DN19281_c0_g1_i2.p1  ORF type:complete len:170 (+),score=14.03 TRINITY_DN19281_c0_g1_i2:137-646(+)